MLVGSAFGQARAASLVSCVDLAKGETPACSDFGACGYDLTKRRFALILGNTSYRHLTPLKTTADDAQEFGDILARDHGYTVRCILNASKAEASTQITLAEAAIKQLAANARDNPDKARFILYFAGHGFDQSDSSNGYLVPVDAPSGPQLRSGSIKVDDLVSGFMTASIVHPFIIIDACKAPTVTDLPTPRAAMKRMSKRGPASIQRGYAPVFAVAANHLARDDEHRFMRYLAPEIVERGRTFGEICNATAYEVRQRQGIVDPAEGPQCRDAWSTVAGKLFDPDASKCEHGFKSAWEAIAAGDRPVTGSMRDYLEDDFKPEPESMSCLLWENALQFASETTCSTALKQRFERYFKTCTKPVAVAMLRLPAPPVAGLANARLSQVIEASRQDGEPAARSASPKRGGGKGAGQPASRVAVADRVVVVATTTETGLRRAADVNEKPHTPFAKGQKLIVDCESMACDNDWVGVRYKPSKDGAETWRGVVPRSHVAPKEPIQSRSVTYKDDDTFGVDSDEIRSIEQIIDAAKANGAAVRYRISGRYSPSDAGGKVSRQLALLRISAIDTVLRKRGAYRNAKADEVRGIELIESDSSSVPSALVEIFAD